METSSLILFYDKCRLCLDRAGVSHIFETEELKQDIFLCTGVKVLLSNDLPQKICSKCLEIVANAKDLRLLATKNDMHLRSLFLNDSDDDTLYICLGNTEDNENTGKKLTFESILPVKEEKEEENKEKEEENKEKEEENKEEEEENKEKEEEKKEKKKEKKKKTRRRLHKNEEESEKSQQQKRLKVRKDLFKSGSKKTTSVKVKTKEEYEKIKKRVKYDPKCETVQYECAMCNKTFETWKKLYLHTRSHNKKFACPLDMCGKMFACKGDLEKHLRTHTGIRPFTCHICDKSFTQQGTLKVHRETVHYCFK